MCVRWPGSYLAALSESVSAGVWSGVVLCGGGGGKEGSRCMYLLCFSRAGLRVVSKRKGDRPKFVETTEGPLNPRMG